MIDPDAVQYLIKQLTRWPKCLSFRQRSTAATLGKWLIVLLPYLLVACSKPHGASAKSATDERWQWNLKTTVEAYVKAGHMDAKWDEPAKVALVEFAKARSKMMVGDDSWPETIGTSAAAAMQAGCTDPMVHYLFIRYSMSQTNTKEAFADAFRDAADDMQNSSYPPVRKFYASLRAAEQIQYAHGGSEVSEEVHQFRQQALAYLVTSLADKSVPPGEVDDACHALLEVIGQNQQLVQDSYNSLEKLLFKNWPNQASLWLFKGEVYFKMAWSARGSGYASEVTADGRKLFMQDLAIAETSAQRAWDLDPKDARIPILMIRIDEGLGKSRDDMELWFSRAMQLAPNSYDACKYKLHYLYPQWYGSREEMIAFGQECVANPAWGGKVPLILLDAHFDYWRYLDEGEDKDNYWKRPDVWPDLQASFDRFFKLNPQAVSWYHNYAWYAYHAEQWDKLNELIPKLENINYNYFGGKEEFDKMVELARAHGAGSPSPTK